MALLKQADRRAGSLVGERRYGKILRRQVTGQDQQIADLVEGIGRTDGKLGPAPGDFNALQFRKLGNQPHITVIRIEKARCVIAEIAGIRRSLQIRTGVKLHRHHGIARLGMRRADAPIAQILAKLDNSAAEQHVEPRQFFRPGGFHQTGNFIGIVELRRKSVNRGNAEFLQQRLCLALGSVVANPDRLVVAAGIGFAHNRHSRIHVAGTRVRLAGIKQFQQFARHNLVVRGFRRGRWQDHKGERKQCPRQDLKELHSTPQIICCTETATAASYWS